MLPLQTSTMKLLLSRRDEGEKMNLASCFLKIDTETKLRAIFQKYTLWYGLFNERKSVGKVAYVNHEGTNYKQSCRSLRQKESGSDWS